ncbi:MAG: hypothetical protein M3004_02790 [Bacteroidota bacterium]|nr:hypothetical protein [Bacteroidota bacterium]
MQQGKNYIFYFLLCIFFNASAQQFGGNPPSIKWKQVNTNESRIIFPQQLDSSAIRIANVFSFLNTSTQNTIGNRSKKINLVLQNQTTISNAYVGLGPYRSEFFLTPLQNSFELGSLPWTDQLAIHEFRHVQQYNNFDVGLSKLLHTLFGEEGQALANSAAIPNWFFEGDAVFNETNVSRQGRGRLAYFFNPYRSLWNTNKNYSWMKLRNGSYKDFVPDHYSLGYLLVAYGREKYGDSFWKNVTHDAASFKGLFYPFQKAIQKYSGKNYVEFRNDALNYFKNILGTKNAANEMKTLPNKEFISEEYPAFANDNSIIYIKSGYKQIPLFIIRNENNEKKIRVRDVAIDNFFSYKNGKIVYASYRPDTRWGYRDYSDLQILDVATGTQHSITNHSKYFSPDINEETNRVVAVHVSPNGKSTLHLLNVADGKIFSSIPNPDNLFYTYPKFYDDKIISAVRNTSGKMSLALINMNSGSAEYLTPFSYNIIGLTTVLHDTIYFSAEQDKEDKLFAVTLNNKKIFELQANITNGLGHYQPSVNNDKIIWTTFTANGFKLQQVNKNQLQWNEITSKFGDNLSDFGISALNKTNANLLGKVSGNDYPVSTYHKSFGLINFHSLEPYFDDPNYTLTLVSENILNTLQSQLSFTYNRTERYKKTGLNFIYGALFPYLSAGINYTIDRRGRYRGKTIFFNELEPNAGINVPLNLTKGRSITHLNIGTNYVYNSSHFQGSYKDTFGTVSYSYLNNFFSISNQIQRAKQQIYPHFAQALSLNYKRAITNFKGSQFVVNANIYLPGFLKTHSLLFNAAYLKKDTIGKLNFSSGFPFSRGYIAENLYEMIKWGANYHLPLFYPDAGFASIVYFSRVRTNLFYDDTHVNDFFTNGKSFSADFRSTGAEIFFDTKWWNEAPITFGFRYSYLLDKDLFGGTGTNRWEFILPINIF